MSCFGGAGAQHACAIARSLNISTLYIHKYAGILSAYGMALADVIHEEQVPCALEFNQQNMQKLNQTLEELAKKCTAALNEQGFSYDQIKTEKYLHMRYQGTDCALMVSSETGDFLSGFLKRYKTEFGFTLQNRSIFIDDIRVRGIGCTNFNEEENLPSANGISPEPVENVQVFFDESYETTNVYKMEQLNSGHVVRYGFKGFK